MPVNWMDVSALSFNSLLMQEQAQLSWFPGWIPEAELALALRANPAVEWYLRHKCPALAEWLNHIRAQMPASAVPSATEMRQAEVAVMRPITDLLVYALDPACYDAQPFLNWDSRELTALIDFSGKVVVDVGAGTGRLTLVAAEKAAAVFAVEPLVNLRAYLKAKARSRGVSNVYAVDGLITDIPFPDQFADVVMGGHVFGDEPEAEYQEMARVTRTGGMMILCPGNSDHDNAAHQALVSHGFVWSRFEEPVDGVKRKYWKTKEV